MTIQLAALAPFGMLAGRDVAYLWEGVQNTVLLFSLAVALGAPLGVLTGIARSNHKIAALRWVTAGYIEIFRSTPLLMQLIVVYYMLPVFGVLVPRMAAAALALSLFSGAYVAEVVRGSIQTIPRQQWEAASAIGMTYRQSLQHVIVPQSLKISLPPLVGFLVALVKGTSLASVIGYVDITLAARRITERTFEPGIVLGVAAFLYFVICYPLSRAGQHWEERLSERHRGRDHHEERRNDAKPDPRAPQPVA